MTYSKDIDWPSYPIVAMLSPVLNSEAAIEVNIAIRRAFVPPRHLLASHTELARKLSEMEKKYD